MNQDNHPAKSSIEKKFQRVAIGKIARYPGLDGLTDFPRDLWQEMAAQGLFGICVPTAHKGHGKSFQTLVNAGKILTAAGGNMGVAMSWLLHEIVASWVIAAFGTAGQKKQYLPPLAQGRKIACFAVSEPNVGAHPKHLSTTADKTSEGYILNGEKTYLTNGPMADLFVVVAVSGTTSGKKQFTAFIVSKTTPGLAITPPLQFPFLHPCPHGGIRLDNCRVNQEQILGEPGKAYEKIVLPFRTVENTLMAGPMAGGLTFLFTQFIDQLNRASKRPDDTLVEAAAQLQCTLEALYAISNQMAAILETDMESDTLISLGLFFRAQAIELLEKIKALGHKTGMVPDQQTIAMQNDLSAVTRIAENVARIKLKKRGRSLFSNPDFFEE